MRVMLQRRAEAGDTIVEVLIALLVASSVLSLTYATMNRNLLITQTNQERTHASKIIQGQIEILKGKSGDSVFMANIASQGTNAFCLDGSGVVTMTDGSAVPVANAQAVDQQTAAYGACNEGSLYYFAVQKTPAAPAGQYTFTVVWNRLGGGNDQIVMSYRI